MQESESNKTLSTLKGILNKANEGKIKLFAYEKAALEEIIDQYETNQRPMSAYFALENWLYETDKPIEIKSAILWGGLSVVHKMGCIDWNTMREMYGEYMSKKMDLR